MFISSNLSGVKISLQVFFVFGDTKNLVNAELNDKLILSFLVSKKSTVNFFIAQSFVLYGQVTKRTRRMPWQLEAMKDVGACDKVRGAGKQALILTFLNGETHLFTGIVH